MTAGAAGPASLSRLATDLGRAADELRRSARALEARGSEGGDGRAPARAAAWARADLGDRPARAQRDLARRTSALVALVDTLIDDFRLVGQALQDAAAGLAETGAERARLEEAIRAAGLVLDRDRVLHPWGIHGEAVAAEDGARDAARREFQVAWDALERRAARRRTVLIDLVSSSHGQRAEWVDRLSR